AGLLVALMAAGGTIASAQEEKGKAQDPFQKLDLSKDQRSKLDKLIGERESSLKAKRQKVLESRKKLVDLLFDKKTSEGEIDKAADQLAKIERDVLLADVKFNKELRKLLSQEQLSNLIKGQK
ncbi:MAG: Spy/CpxP family protein refolding chaperone, partial [Candidatus Methylomirabilaceae bacterium]